MAVWSPQFDALRCQHRGTKEIQWPGALSFASRQPLETALVNGSAVAMVTALLVENVAPDGWSCVDDGCMDEHAMYWYVGCKYKDLKPRVLENKYAKREGEGFTQVVAFSNLAWKSHGVRDPRADDKPKSGLHAILAKKRNRAVPDFQSLSGLWPFFGRNKRTLKHK